MSPAAENGQVASLLMLSPSDDIVPVAALQLPPALFATMAFFNTGSQPAEVRPMPPPVLAELLLIVTLRRVIVTCDPSPFVAFVAEWRTPPPVDPLPPVIVLSLIVTLVRVAL
jgi:hypothetical protein